MSNNASNYKATKPNTTEGWQDELYNDFDALYNSMCLDDRCKVTKTRDSYATQTQTQPNRASNVGSDSNAFDQTMRMLVGSCVPGPMSPSDFNAKPNNDFEPTDAAQSLWLESSDQTRADSRDTYQSIQNGPALVEEMTLTDLEDEISSTLMASKEAARIDKENKTTKQLLVKPTARPTSDSITASFVDRNQQQHQPLVQMIRNDLTEYQRRFIR